MDYNTQMLSKRGLLLFVNKKNPDKFIIVLGTVHIGMPSEGIYRYFDFIDDILEIYGKNILLRPEVCFTSFTSYLFLSTLSSLFSASLVSKDISFSSYRKKLKTDEGKKRFDNIMKTYDIKDKTQKIREYMRRLYIKHPYLMDIEIMTKMKGKMKCKSLDNMIMAPFWEKNVREHVKLEKKSEKEKSEMQRLNEFESGLKRAQDPLYMSKMINNTEKQKDKYLLTTKRNRIWKKKLIDEKTPIQIALVGYAHLRSGENSLKKLFQKDDNWDVYDFQDMKGINGIYTFEDMINFVKRGIQKTRPSDLLRICEGTQKSGKWENHRFTNDPKIDTINVDERTKPTYLGNFVNHNFKNRRYKIISSRNCVASLFFRNFKLTTKRFDIQLNEKFWKKVYTLLEDEGHFRMDNFSLFSTKQLKRPFKGLEYSDIFMKKLNSIEGVRFKMMKRNDEIIVLKKISA